MTTLQKTFSFRNTNMQRPAISESTNGAAQKLNLLPRGRLLPHLGTRLSKDAWQFVGRSNLSLRCHVLDIRRCRLQSSAANDNRQLANDSMKAQAIEEQDHGGCLSFFVESIHPFFISSFH